MPVTFVAAGAVASNATITTQAIVAPACAAGDILICALINRGATANAFSPPDGTWTEVIAAGTNNSGGVGDHQYGLYWKRATGSGGSFTFSKATDDNLAFGGVIVAYRGAKSSGSPLDATAAAVTKTTSASDNVTFPAYDPTSTDNRVIFVAFYGNDLTTFAAAMSEDVNPNCTIDCDVESSQGSDFGIAITSGTNDGASVPSRTWASAATVDAGNSGVVFALVADVPPTTVLNSPANASSDSDTTPTLDFTATDDVGLSVEYEVSISKFGSLIDSYPESNQSVALNLGGGSGIRVQHGQSFVGNGSNIGCALFYLKLASGALTGNVYAKIFAHSGTYGTSSVPTGSALATSDPVDPSILTSSYQLIRFIFTGSQQITLTNGTNYCIVIEYEGGNVVNYIQVGQDNTSPSHGGNSFQNLSTVASPTWSAISTFDCCFYIYASSSTLSKLSVSDSGFVNPDTGGDTHPFNSGENIQFTVQAGDALVVGTYYWRVRAIDPTGTNTWGKWTDARSFIVSAPATLVAYIGIKNTLV